METFRYRLTQVHGERYINAEFGNAPAEKLASNALLHTQFEGKKPTSKKENTRSCNHKLEQLEWHSVEGIPAQRLLIPHNS